MTKTGQSTVAGAQTLFRALDILDCFTHNGASLSLAELSKSVGLTPPTTHRLVKALISRRFLVADEQRRYSLGPAVMSLAAVVMERADDLVTVVTPSLVQLREITGETASLHTLLGDSRICVAEIVSAEPIRMESGIGRTYPLYAGAAGKALLAWLPERVERICASMVAVGPATLDEKELVRDLERIRRRGYAVSEAEVYAGAASFAVPVFGPSGVIGAVNVAGPSMRWNRSKIAACREQVLAEVESLTARLSSTRELTAG